MTAGKKRRLSYSRRSAREVARPVGVVPIGVGKIVISLQRQGLRAARQLGIRIGGGRGIHRIHAVDGRILVYVVDDLVQVGEPRARILCGQQMEFTTRK